MSDEKTVPIDIDVLGTLLCYAGLTHVGVDYCIGLEIIRNADLERAIGVLEMLNDNHTPAQVAHIATQLGIDPAEVQGGGSS